MVETLKGQLRKMFFTIPSYRIFRVRIQIFYDLGRKLATLVI
jgi:hypothetical protein